MTFVPRHAPVTACASKILPFFLSCRLTEWYIQRESLFQVDGWPCAPRGNAQVVGEVDL